jgi:anti-anti-sigma factor
LADENAIAWLPPGERFASNRGDWAMNEQRAQIMPVVVVLAAEIDVTNSDRAYQQLAAALAPGVSTVIADLTSTSFCDSSGVHAILRAHDRAAAWGAELRLAVSPGGSVRRVLELTGAASVMPVYSNVAEAMGPA